MKLVDASIQDGKMCSQLLNFLKIARLPENMAVADCIALSETMAWLNGLVKQLAGELSSKPKTTEIRPLPPTVILPVPKKKGKK